MRLENYKMISMVPMAKGSKAVICTYVHKQTGEEVSIGRMMKKILIKTERVNITIETTEMNTKVNMNTTINVDESPVEIEMENIDPVKVDVIETEEEVKVSVRDRSCEFNYVVARYRERAEKLREEEAKRPAWIKATEKFVNNASKIVEEVIDVLSR